MASKKTMKPSAKRTAVPRSFFSSRRIIVAPPGSYGSPLEPHNFDLVPGNIHPAGGRPPSEERGPQVHVVALDPRAIVQNGDDGIAVVPGRDVGWNTTAVALPGPHHPA